MQVCCLGIRTSNCLQERGGSDDLGERVEWGLLCLSCLDFLQEVVTISLKVLVVRLQIVPSFMIYLLLQQIFPVPISLLSSY